MFLLKHSTASQVIPLGFYLDSTDGDTAETGLTIANTDLQVWKTGATSLVAKNSGGATHMSIGVYQATLDATDTNTLGPIKIYSHVAGALVVVFEGVVVPVITYDALVTNGLNDIAATDVVSAGAITTLSGAIVNVDLVDTLTTYTGNTPQTADHTAGIADIPTVSEFNARTILSANYSTASNLATVDSNVDAILVDTSTTIPAQITALNDFNPAIDTVANVTLVATTTTNTDMVGTNNALLAASYTAPDNAGITQIQADISALNDISVAQIFAGGDMDGFNLEESQKLILAASAGTLSGAATTTVTITAVDGSKARLTATVDGDGNRSAVIKDATG